MVSKLKVYKLENTYIKFYIIQTKGVIESIQEKGMYQRNLVRSCYLQINKKLQ